MQTPSNSMITKNSPQQRRHPWTRVSWISGSDVDSLDEEEVQEVESITLGRAFDGPPEPVAAAASAAAPSVISPGNESDEDTKQSASVTLKPFRFGTSGDDESSSLLAPFAFPNSNTSSTAANPYGVAPTKLQQESSDKEILVSQKGHLITPAVTDAVSEDDEAPPTPKKRTSWKSFWSQGATEEDNKEPEEIKAVKTVTAAADDETWTAQDLAVEQEPELQEEETTMGNNNNFWSTMMASRRLQAANATATLQEMMKGCSLWVVDGFLKLWTKWITFGVLVDTYLRNGVNATKAVARDTSNKIIAAWEASSPAAAAAFTVIPADSVSAIGVGCLLFIAFRFLLPAFTSSTPRIPSPTNDLRDFVRFEKAHNLVDLKQIDDLNTEAFRTYARSTCVEAATYEQARSALDIGLFGVPDSVRATLVQMAVQEGVTQKNSIQDSNSDFVESGKADAFMAFWSTVYDPAAAAAAEGESSSTYKTCVMVTGVALTVAETIAEWTTKKEKYQIGTEPCHCGYVYCEECPIFDVREVKWPVFERRSLSLRKQEELRRWMVDQAIKSAEHLVLDGTTEQLEGGSSSLTLRPAFAWTGQTSAAFFGEESHNDRVAAAGSGSIVSSSSSSIVYAQPAEAEAAATATATDVQEEL